MPEVQFPANRTIILFAFLLGVASSLVQIWFPRDTAITELNLQLENFPQYIAMFIFGLMAYPRNWFASLPEQTAQRWMIVVFLLSFLPILVGFKASPQAGGGVEMILNLIANWWEAFMCVGMSMTVVYLFRKHANQQGQFASWLSHTAYTAYLIHEPIIASAALIIASIMFYPLLKFALMGFVTVPLIFLFNALIRKIPFTERVL